MGGMSSASFKESKAAASYDHCLPRSQFGPSQLLIAPVHVVSGSTSPRAIEHCKIPNLKHRDVDAVKENVECMVIRYCGSTKFDA